MQRAVDLSIMSELGGTSVEPTLVDVDVRLKSFPYPPYLYDEFGGREMQLSMMIYLFFCFAFVGESICTDIVLEKEKKLKAGVLSHG